MLSITVVAVIASFIDVEYVDGRILNIDAEKLVKSLKQQLEDEQQNNQILYEIPAKGQRQDDDGDDDTFIFGSLKDNDARPNKLHKNRVGQDYKQVYVEDDSNDRDLDQQILEQLNALESLQNKNKKRKRAKPNSLLSSALGLPYEDTDNKVLQSDKTDLDFNNYSQIYLVLNPEAVQNPKNRDRLNDLLSVLLPSSKPRKKEKKERRYRGFVIRDANDNSIKRRRLSQEVYERDESSEKHKKKRNDYGGGGGGGGGRTAIPYVHHRGDIYEKDD